MSKDVISREKGKPFVYLTGVLIGVAATFLCMLISAAAILFLNLDRAYSIPLATVCLAVGSFATAYYVSSKIRNKGYLIGLLTGFISFGFVTVISLIINKSGLSINTLFHFIIIMLSSAIGGILGVNKGENKKYI